MTAIIVVTLVLAGLTVALGLLAFAWVMVSDYRARRDQDID